MRVPVLSWLWNTLKPFLLKVFEIAQDHGLTDAIQEKAVALVEEAATQFADNETRREWVVSMLVAAKVPESIARLAVELAVQVFKARRGEAPEPT